MGLLLLLDASYTSMISSLLLLHMCPQYITLASGILSNHTFYVGGQVRKWYFGLTGLHPWDNGPDHICYSMKLLSLVKLQAATYDCTGATDSDTEHAQCIPVGWAAFLKAEQGTYTLCPWAGWGSCVNQASLSSSSDVLEQEAQSWTMGASLVLAADESRDCTQHRKKNPRERYDKSSAI